MEYPKNSEVIVHKFFITIKKNNKIFGNLEKHEIDLNTSKDIVNQAEQFTSKLLDLLETPQESRTDISWKIYRGENNQFMMVSQSKNWEE